MKKASCVSTEACYSCMADESRSAASVQWALEALGQPKRCKKCISRDLPTLTHFWTWILDPCFTWKAAICCNLVDVMYKKPCKLEQESAFPSRKAWIDPKRLENLHQAIPLQQNLSFGCLVDQEIYRSVFSQESQILQFSWSLSPSASKYLFNAYRQGRLRTSKASRADFPKPRLHEQLLRADAPHSFHGLLYQNDQNMQPRQKIGATYTL